MDADVEDNNESSGARKNPFIAALETQYLEMTLIVLNIGHGF